ncbi:hypothetical protein [Brevibacterium casei]|nr:hypothetical protein [Brevibacterium casei]
MPDSDTSALEPDRLGSIAGEFDGLTVDARPDRRGGRGQLSRATA